MSGSYNFSMIQQLTSSEYPCTLEAESWVALRLTESDENGKRCVDDLEQAPSRKKRLYQPRDGEAVSPSSQTMTSMTPPVAPPRERQRGKNWEKKEEDILVDCKSQDQDWKAISENLHRLGYHRNHKHCADKWYALRKHYLEIHQWMRDHPGLDFWDRSDGERPRNVGPSFTRRWYHIFEAAEKKERGKKHHPRKDLTPHQAAGTHFQSTAAVVKSELFRSEPGSIGAQPSCGPANYEPLQHPSLGRFGSAHGAALKVEPGLDDIHGLGCSTRIYPTQLDYDLVVSEIEDLKRVLQVQFAADLEERTRHLEYKERKLQLKEQKLAHKRKRDDEKQQSDPQRLNSRDR